VIVKAIHLLHRWLAHDAENIDETLDDETNDLLLAYAVPRAEHEQAVLDAMARASISDPSDGFPVIASLHHEHALCRAELARRQAIAEANESRRGLTAAAPEVRAAARAALRRLESLR
jgi:hypothetical protein